jgi:hypothetical protein
MPEEIFTNLSLEIRSSGDRFEARIHNEADDSGDCGTFERPDLSGLEALLEGFGPPPSETARDLRLAAPARLPTLSAEEAGSRLFDALLPGPVREVFRTVRGRIDVAHPDGIPRGLRLRLRMDARDQAVLPLAALPWELLYDPLNHDFYGQGRRRLLVRHITAPQGVQPLAVSPPLKILAVAAAPRGLPSLDLGQELRNLQDAFREDDRIRILPLEGDRATFEHLRRALRDEEPHILHFMGHGDFRPATGEGLLLFRDGNGRQEVPGKNLADLLKDFGIRLVVLNACRSAQMPRLDGQSPYATVGAALSLSGVPAVVAMQLRVRDAAALLFSRAFYEALASGDPVDVAAGEGRRALYLDRHQSFEWIAPVLFLRARDGHLFDLPHREPSPPRERRETALDPGAGARVVGIRSLEPHGARPDPTLHLTRHFDGRPIREPRLWNEAVLPELTAFLREQTRDRHPLVLDFAAHSTLAFAAGYILEAKTGLDLAVRQRQRTGRESDWTPGDGPLPEGPFWMPEDDQRIDDQATGVAMAAGITLPVLDDVRAYLDRSPLRVRRLLSATATPEWMGQVVNGHQAWALAQSVALRINARTAHERPGTLHLFISAPNAFLFYLGQLARSFGRIQLYEYDFESKTLGAYTPSIVLPG